MGMAISDFWNSRWVANPEYDFGYVLINAWSLSGTRPVIDAEYNYRSTDVAHNESILIKLVSENDEFLGLGGNDYKRDITLVITIRTSGDRNRKSALLAEVRRILRNVPYWTGGQGTGYNMILINHMQDSVDRLRKMSELKLTITCWRAERNNDSNL